MTQVVAGSAADRAGLVAGDVILALNGSPTTSVAALGQAVSSSSSGVMTLNVRSAINGQVVSRTLAL